MVAVVVGDEGRAVGCLPLALASEGDVAVIGNVREGDTVVGDLIWLFGKHRRRELHP